MPVAHDVGDDSLDGIDIPEFPSVWSKSEHGVLILFNLACEVRVIIAN
jgi:hypothetical protein